MTEQDIQKDTVQTTDDTAVKPLEEMTTDEIKAEAERLEALNKAKKTDTKDDQIRNDQIRRLEKARERSKQTAQPASNNDTKETTQAPEFAVEDLVTLEVKGIAKDSDEAKVLKRYRDAGIIKDFKTGLDHVGVKAELDAIASSRTARTVVTDNDKDSKGASDTKKDLIARYEAQGEVPSDAKSQKVIADHNLEKMNLK